MSHPLELPEGKDCRVCRLAHHGLIKMEDTSSKLMIVEPNNIYKCMLTYRWVYPPSTNKAVPVTKEARPPLK